MILCDPLGKFLWRSILQRPVRATLVIRLPYEVGVNYQLSANPSLRRNLMLRRTYMYRECATSIFLGAGGG